MNRITLPLLALSVSLASVLCLAAEPNADQASAIAAIEKLGGKVTFAESPQVGGPVIQFVAVNAPSVDLAKSKVTDAGLVYLKGLPQLQIIGPDFHAGDRRGAGAPQRVDATEFAGPDFHAGDRCRAGSPQGVDRNCSSLDLTSTQVTDAGLEHLKGWTQLTSLAAGTQR